MAIFAFCRLHPSEPSAKVKRRIHPNLSIHFNMAASKVPIIIGVSGKAHSGKDTVADMILIKLNHIAKAKEETPWVKRSFAYAMKRSVEQLLDLPDGAADEPKYREQFFLEVNCTLARFMQVYAQSLRENVDADIWVNLLFKNYCADQRWIISDVRYPNEANRIEEGEYPGLVVRVERKADLFDGRSMEHISELALDEFPFKYRIDNSGTLKETEQQIDALLHKWGLC